MPKTVDSFRFISGITKRMINGLGWKSPVRSRGPRLPNPSECTVTLISSAGIALKTDTPFDQEGERQNPWWGDPTYRVLPISATRDDIRLYHLHIDPSYAEQDLNCLFPLEHLQAMQAKRRIGRVASRHYSYMGYILNPERLLRESVPALIRDLKANLADVVVLVPA